MSQGALFYSLRNAELDDLAYHQARVLQLVIAVSSKGHGGMLDGLTKLAKLDFLVRYPSLAPVVIDGIDTSDERLHLDDPVGSAASETPMIRYKFGPWDDKYYPVIGALVGRALVRYAQNRKGSVALAPTAAGRRLAASLLKDDNWKIQADRCQVIAEATAGMNGSQLKEKIYERLPELLNRPQRDEIR